jgi:hypothetical protein
MNGKRWMRCLDRVVDLGHVVEDDVTDINAVARIDEEGQTHFLLAVIGGRHRIDLREGITVEAEAVLDQFLGRRDVLLGVGVTGLYQQVVLQLRLGDHEGTGELDVAELEDLAFVDVDGDEDVVLLGSDRHLRRLDLEVRVAAVHVVGAQFLEIALQRLARIPVVLLVPGEPVRGLQLEIFEHVVLTEAFVADQVDLPDPGALAFLDVDLDAHAVVGRFLDLSVDAHGVFAAAVVLVGQELLDVLEHRAVKGLAGRQTHVAQALVEILGLDVLVALDLETLYRRALEHGDDQRALLPAQLDVTEEAGVIERADRLAHPLLGEPVADVHRQVVVDRTLGDALQTLDADVVDAQHRRLRPRWRLRGGRAGLLCDERRGVEKRRNRQCRDNGDAGQGGQPSCLVKSLKRATPMSRSSSAIPTCWPSACTRSESGEPRSHSTS